MRSAAVQTAHDAIAATPVRVLSQRMDVPLVLIVLLGAALRLLYVTAPLAEAHRWRQVTNADIARNFAEGPFDILHPQVNWGGPSGYVGMEFPLLHACAAVLYRLFGEDEILCRLSSIAFSLATIVVVYAIGRRLFNPLVGRAAAFFIALSPTAVFFGRTFISDTPMLFFSTAAVLAYVVYFQGGSHGVAAGAAALMALACLVKVPAVIILAPIMYLAWTARRWRAVRDPWFVFGIVGALAVTGAWYWHADNLYHRTGLGQAIWHPSGTYPPSIAVAAGPMFQVSHWSTVTMLLNLEFYSELLRRFWYVHFTPAGFALIIFSLATAWGARNRRIIDVWFATVVLFILVAAEGNRYHEFHQLPILPPAALLFGLVAAPAFGGEWLRARAGGWWGVPAGAAALTSIGLLGFYFSGIVQYQFRPENLDLGPIQSGRAIGSVVPYRALVIVVEYDLGGNNSPILLYHARRRGWSFDLQSITPHVIRRLKDHFGADYFATTMWSRLQTARPEAAAYLGQLDAVPLPRGTPPDTVVFALR